MVTLNLGNVRRLMRSSNGKATSPQVLARTISVTPNTKNMGVGHAVTKSNNIDVVGDLGEVTAASSPSTSNIGPRNVFEDLLNGYISNTDGNSANKKGSIEPDTEMSRMYRDIYNSDPICGSAVDLMSNMPFSDFTLAGAKDAKYLSAYEESLDNMHMQAFLPVLSTEYLVEGRQCSTTLFDENEGHYTGIVPQDTNYVSVLPVPIFGVDPIVTLRLGDAIKQLRDAKDPRVQEYLTRLNIPADGQHKPDPKDVIYIARSNLNRDVVGTSIYRRIVPAWILEKAMYRGTLDQAFKRQRAIAHMTVGDEEWTPTPEEMQQLATMLMAADLDPVGAVMVTRNGVNVNEIRSGDAFWKVTDLSDFFTTVKLRALGISEAFLSGESTFNSLDQVLSVYVENMRAYRDKITAEIFYERLFPRIAEARNYTQKAHGLSLQTASESETDNVSGVPNPYFIGASEEPYRRISLKHSKMLIPQVYWHKRLRPEADSAYLEVLNTMTEKGIPVPVRLWAAAGGLDLKSLLNQKDEDMKIRDEIKDWNKSIAKSLPGGDMMGGMDGGGGEDGGELASVTASSFRRRGILSRGSDEAMEKYSARNTDGTGKRHLLSRKGQKALEQSINKNIAEVAASLAQRLNRMEARMEEKFREANSTSKTYG